MRRIMCLCNTYYQLIVSMQLKETLFENDNISVILTDHSCNSEKITKQLKQLNYFDNVFHIKVRELDQEKHNIIEATSTILDGITGRGTWKMLFEEVAYFDEIIFFNLNMSTVQIFTYLIKKNPGLKCSRFEEGILSYSIYFHDGDSGNLPVRIKSIFLLRKFLGQQNLPNCIENFYCFYPNIYKGKLNPIALSQISAQGKLKDVLYKTFMINSSKLKYKEPYIFLTSVYDFEGGESIGEFELVKQVAELVGKDNLLVKQHPRDIRNVYKEAGFHVDQNSMVPWEIVQLCFDFKNNILMTVNSGGILSSNLMINDGPKAYFMYRLCDFSGNQLAMQTIKCIEELMSNHTMAKNLSRVRIALKLEEILD